MHNIDRTLQESGAMGYEFEQEYETGSNHEQGHEFGHEFEFGQESSNEFGHEFEFETNHEQHELEMTYELMTVTNEMELNHFLGGLMGKALGAAKGAASAFVKSNAGKGVGRYLMNFGKNTLPQLAAKYGGQALGAAGGKLGGVISDKLGGGFLGNTIATGLQKGGQWVGQQGGQWAGSKVGGLISDKAQQIFNLEFENMSHEDREFEVARSYVRFATDLTRRANNAVSRNPSIPLSSLASQVIPQSAAQFAPGLLASKGSAAKSGGGNWVRRGNSIVIYGV